MHKILAITAIASCCFAAQAQSYNHVTNPMAPRADAPGATQKRTEIQPWTAAVPSKDNAPYTGEWGESRAAVRDQTRDRGIVAVPLRGGEKLHRCETIASMARIGLQQRERGQLDAEPDQRLKEYWTYPLYAFALKFGQEDALNKFEAQRVVVSTCMQEFDRFWEAHQAGHPLTAADVRVAFEPAKYGLQGKYQAP